MEEKEKNLVRRAVYRLLIRLVCFGILWPLQQILLRSAFREEARRGKIIIFIPLICVQFCLKERRESCWVR